MQEEAGSLELGTHQFRYLLALQGGGGAQRLLGVLPLRHRAPQGLNQELGTRDQKKQEYHQRQETPNTPPCVWWVWLASLRLPGVYLG